MADLLDRWRWDIAVAVVVVAYSVVLGGAAGAIWQAHASRIDLGTSTSDGGAVNGSEAAMKALLDDDMQFALIAIAAGLVAVLLLLVASRGQVLGVGAAVGIAIGGVLGSIVAAHVGGMARHGGFTATMNRSFPGITPKSLANIRGYFGFRLRARVVLMAWPLVALASYAAAAALRPQQRS